MALLGHEGHANIGLAAACKQFLTGRHRAGEFDAMGNAERGCERAELFEIAFVAGRFIADGAQLHLFGQQGQRFEHGFWQSRRYERTMVENPEIDAVQRRT